MAKRPVSIVIAGVGAALVALVVWVLGPGARWVLEHVDGVMISGPMGLAGKDLAAAVDAVRGRVLAIATGLAALVAVIYAARNADTARRTFQLGERGHVTDRYGRAVEQLGSDQAPVRLGGLYALEDLAQATPELRQTIVAVICAYLRMPFAMPTDRTTPDKAAGPDARDDGGSTPGRHDPHEELQVRVTAQRILTAHLRYQPPPSNRWWQSREADADLRHWPDINLDLTGAMLVDFEMSKCQVTSANFTGTTFTGCTDFERTTFSRYATFAKATFTDRAAFHRAGFAWVVFDGVAFNDRAEFGGVAFAGEAGFVEAAFTSRADFERATFTGVALFAKATFRSEAVFARAAFNDTAVYSEAAFADRATFHGVAFTKHAEFIEAAFASEAVFDDVTFTREAQFTRAAFTDHAVSFYGATFTSDAWFTGATGLANAHLDRARVLPRGLATSRTWPKAWVEVPGSEGEGGWLCLRTARATRQEPATAEPGRLG
ncbi:pentapeptide repeat-containing protein [Nonomuraea basaltis]|uniref:pentapeptide repeat-containing protein n=1 Tax=Nonomuraea basaltis TaxID=2495887 RepID=UPI00110C59B7|nr:pentapeptide repeat-containing protein [Nonomuraea basaltis]TMR90601.1 pentapeptide repeat-containing protein [Nonomuraea basaltis]